MLVHPRGLGGEAARPPAVERERLGLERDRVARVDRAQPEVPVLGDLEPGVERPDLVGQRLREERHRRDEVLLEDREPLALRLREAALVARARRVDPAREEPVAVRGRDPAVRLVDREQRLEVARQQDVVGVAERDQLAPRLGQAAVPRGGDARVLLRDDPDRARERAARSRPSRRASRRRRRRPRGRRTSARGRTRSPRRPSSAAS